MSRRSTPRRVIRGKITRASRAAKYEMIYRALGETRSVRAVWEMVRSSGDPIDRSTLERYSADYDWVSNAAAFDAARAQVVSGVVLEHAVADTVRHAEFGRAMQELAAQAIRNRSKDPDSIELTGSEIARLGDVGVRIERLASGMATERIEIMSSAMRVVIEDIGPLVVQMSEEIAALIERHVRPVDPALANLLQVGVDDARANFATSADRVVDANFRAYGLLAEQATVPDDGDDDD